MKKHRSASASSLSAEALKRSLDVLHQGGILLTPTDTIWGLSCDATSEAAVEQLIRLKQRPAEKSFIILLDADYKLEQYLNEVPAVAYDLIEFSEKPLTIIFDGGRRLAPNILHSDGSVGIRIVKNASFCKKLLERFRKPIVSTSANFSGEASPATLDQVNERLRAKVDYTVPAELAPAGSGKASTIVRLGPQGEYTLIRK